MFAFALFAASSVVGVVAYATQELPEPHMGIQSVRYIDDSDGFRMNQLAEAYYHNFVEMTSDEEAYHIAKVDELLAIECYYERDLRLAEFGVFNLDTHRMEGEFVGIAPMTSPAHVNMERVTVVFDSARREWVLSGRGNWRGHYVRPPTLWWAPRVGDNVNVGSLDYVGILLMDTWGSFNGVSITGGSANFTNGRGANSTATRSHIVSSSGGAVFALQDRLHVTAVRNFVLFANITWYYNAFNFNTTVRFNDAFRNYRGNAVLFYAHTWANAQLTGLSIGATSVSASWSGNNNRFTALSLDTRF